MKTVITFIKEIMRDLKEKLKEFFTLFEEIKVEVENGSPSTPPIVEPEKPLEEEPVIEMKFKKGDVITLEDVERVILEVYNGYYIWGYEYAPEKSWDSRNSSEPLLERWELKKEIVKNIIAEFEPYTGTPVTIPATDDNSFLDEDGNTVPFTINIPLLINENDTGFIISKSDRQLGTEWMLRPYKGDLQFSMSRSSNSAESLRITIPIKDLPREFFDLTIRVDFSRDEDNIKVYINARRVDFDTTHNSFTGFEKTNAPIRVGGNGWNYSKFTGKTGKATIEKGRIWSVEEIIENYEKVFNITNLFLEPSDDGTVHIPVIPNTGQEVGFELLEAFRRVKNGSDVVVAKGGNYLVDLDLHSRNQQAAIEFYGKNNIVLDAQEAKLYTSRFGVIDFSKKGLSDRLQLNVMDSENITIRNLNIESVYVTHKKYIKALEQEHGISNTKSKNIVYENITVKNVGGDGLYFKYCENVTLKNIVTDGTNRMGIGISHESYNIKIDNFEAYNCSRASLDLEGDNKGRYIDGVELTNSYLTNYLAAAGNSIINNVNIHHNRYITSIIMKGGMWIDNPNYNPNEIESLENQKEIPREMRENWVIEDNEYIGGGGSPVAMVRIRYCKNVKINRNNIVVPTSQGRKGVELTYCSGRIEFMDNKYVNPCIHRIVKCYAGTEVIIDEPNNDNVYIIEIDGVKETRGTNPELLALIEKKGY